MVEDPWRLVLAQGTSAQGQDCSLKLALPSSWSLSCLVYLYLVAEQYAAVLGCTSAFAMNCRGLACTAEMTGLSTETDVGQPFWQYWA